MFYPTKTAIACTIAAVLVTLSVPLTVQAQEAKPARIGLLRTSPPLPQYIKQFHAGMRQRGHTEGRTYVLVPGWGKSRRDRSKILELAENLVARDVDVIVTLGTAAARSARRAAPSTPIVMASAGNRTNKLLLDRARAFTRSAGQSSPDGTANSNKVEAEVGSVPVILARNE